MPGWVFSRAATIGCSTVLLGGFGWLLVTAVVSNPAYALRFWGVTIGMVLVSIAVLAAAERMGLMPKPGIGRELAALVLGALWLGVWFVILSSP